MKLTGLRPAAVLAIAAVVMAFALPAMPSARADDPSLATIKTVYGGSSSCSATRSVSVPPGVPVPIDAGGTPEPDLLVHLAAVPPPAGDGAATLSIERLTVAPIRVSVSVSYASLAFGYDACAAGAPQSFRARAIASAQATTLNVDTSGATSSLRLTGSSGNKVLSANLAPVPASTTVTVSSSSSGVTGTLTTDVPTRIDLAYTEGSTTAATITLNRFPGTARIEASPSMLSYTASGSIAEATIDLRRGSDRLTIALTGVPTELRIDRTASTHATLRSGPIGSLTATLTSGSVTPPTVTGDHLAVRKSGSAFAARVRLRQVTAADIDWGDPVVVDVRHAGGPFAVVADLDGLEIFSTIRDLPSRAAVRAARDGRTIAYTGSAVIGELFATIQSASPLFGRARRASLLARQIPTSVNLDLGPSGSSFELDANGASIGLVELLLSSGPDERLASTTDGVLLRDLPDRWVAFARVTGLRKVAYADTTTVLSSFELPFVGRISSVRHLTSATLNTAGGRPLRVDVRRTANSEPDDVTDAILTLTSMPRDITASVTRYALRSERTGAESDGTMKIAYDASARTGGLTFTTDAGDRHSLRVSLSPMPASLDVCSSPGNDCAPEISLADKGSNAFRASERTHLEVYDCAKPDGGCTEDYTSVDLWLQTLAIGVDERSDGFRIFMDNNATPMSGRMLKRIGGTREYDFRFPNVSQDLWTQNRDVVVSCGAVYCSGDASGSMHCPSGTAFDVNTHHWRWGTANFAEEICPG